LPATPFAKGFISPSSYNIKANERIKCREGGRGKWNGELTAVGWWGGRGKMAQAQTAKCQTKAKEPKPCQNESKRDTRHWNKLRWHCGAKYAKRKDVGWVNIHPSIYLTNEWTCCSGENFAD